MIDKRSKIYIAGHNGMVGSACYRLLENNGFDNIVCKSSQELDLRNQEDVYSFVSDEKPDVIIDAAAKVGGILANSNYPYNFIFDNLSIQNSLIGAAHEIGVSKFIFLGSSCIYPKLSPQPIIEDSLLTSSLEPTNEWYAVAKIAGLKLVEALNNQFNRKYVSLMPTNLYGPNDNFNLKTSHVLPALIRKFHEAKEDGHKNVTLWGSGKPLREFLHVDDLAEAIFYFIINDEYKYNLYNVGSGEEISIFKLAKLIQSIIGHEGQIIWDSSKPDGTPRKLLDSKKLLNLGWKPRIQLEKGIQQTYHWFLKNT